MNGLKASNALCAGGWLEPGRLSRRVLCLLVLLGITTTSPNVSAQESAWNQLPDLPVEIGLGGPLVGTFDDSLWVIGGANFPNGAPWDDPPGAKVWHADIYELESPQARWQKVGSMPQPVAYGVTVSLPDGLLLIGGEDGGIANRLAWWLHRDSTTQGIRLDRLADLPEPMSYHAGGKLRDAIVLATSSRSSDSGPLDTKSFWQVDLAAWLATATQTANEIQTPADSLDPYPPAPDLWEQLPTWPGSPRLKAVGVVQTNGLRDGFYLISGENAWLGEDGKPELSRFEYLSDGYRFDPEQAAWEAIASLPAVPEIRPDASPGQFDELPKPVAAAPAVAIGSAHIVVFSGSTGRYIERPSPEIPGFPTDVLAYHAITDTWSQQPPMPLGVVTTTAVNWKNRVVIPSGETRPAVRTPKVQTWRPLPMKRPLGMVNIGVIVVYLLGLVAVGYYFSRRERGTDDFFLAGRRIPWWAAGLSIYATQLSAITYVSIPATAFAENWLTFIGQIAIPIMAPLVVFCYLPFYRRLNLTTVYEYLEMRFHRVVRWYGSLSFVAFQLIRIALVVYLPALALSAVTGWGVQGCILVMGILAIAYTVLGGIEAVIWTDVVQVVVLWGGILFALLLAVSDAGGWQATWDIATRYDKLQWWEGEWSLEARTTMSILIGSCLLQLGPYTTDQAVIQRYLTTRTEAEAARGIWLNAWLAVPFSLVFFAMGTALFAYFHNAPGQLDVGMENDRVLPLFVVQRLPIGVSGLVIAGIFAASMSTLDSSMHSIATTLSHDFYRLWKPAASASRQLAVARLLTLLAGLAGTGAALTLATWEIQSVFLSFQQALGLVSSPLAGVFVLGIFTRRTHALGALTGAAVSIAVLYCVKQLTDWNFYWHSLIGLSVCVVVGYATSRLAPATQPNLTGLCWHSRRSKASEMSEAGEPRD